MSTNNSNQASSETGAGPASTRDRCTQAQLLAHQALGYDSAAQTYADLQARVDWYNTAVDFLTEPGPVDYPNTFLTRVIQSIWDFTQTNTISQYDWSQLRQFFSLAWTDFPSLRPSSPPLPPNPLASASGGSINPPTTTTSQAGNPGTASGKGKGKGKDAGTVTPERRTTKRRRSGSNRHQPSPPADYQPEDEGPGNPDDDDSGSSPYQPSNPQTPPRKKRRRSAGAGVGTNRPRKMDPRFYEEGGRDRKGRPYRKTVYIFGKRCRVCQDIPGSRCMSSYVRQFACDRCNRRKEKCEFAAREERKRPDGAWDEVNGGWYADGVDPGSDMTAEEREIEREKARAKRDGKRSAHSKKRGKSRAQKSAEFVDDEDTDAGAGAAESGPENEPAPYGPDFGEPGPSSGRRPAVAERVSDVLEVLQDLQNSEGSNGREPLMRAAEFITSQSREISELRHIVESLREDIYEMTQEMLTLTWSNARIGEALAATRERLNLSPLDIPDVTPGEPPRGAMETEHNEHMDDEDMEEHQEDPTATKQGGDGSGSEGEENHVEERLDGPREEASTNQAEDSNMDDDEDVAAGAGVNYSTGQTRAAFSELFTRQHRLRRGRFQRHESISSRSPSPTMSVDEEPSTPAPEPRLQRPQRVVPGPPTNWRPAPPSRPASAPATNMFPVPGQMPTVPGPELSSSTAAPPIQTNSPAPQTTNSPAPQAQIPPPAPAVVPTTPAPERSQDSPGPVHNLDAPGPATSTSAPPTSPSTNTSTTQSSSTIPEGGDAQSSGAAPLPPVATLGGDVHSSQSKDATDTPDADADNEEDELDEDDDMNVDSGISSPLPTLTPELAALTPDQHLPAPALPPADNDEVQSYGIDELGRRRSTRERKQAQPRSATVKPESKKGGSSNKPRQSVPSSQSMRPSHLHPRDMPQIPPPPRLPPGDLSIPATTLYLINGDSYGPVAVASSEVD